MRRGRLSTRRHFCRDADRALNWHAAAAVERRTGRSALRATRSGESRQRRESPGRRSTRAARSKFPARPNVTLKYMADDPFRPCLPPSTTSDPVPAWCSRPCSRTFDSAENFARRRPSATDCAPIRTPNSVETKRRRIRRRKTSSKRSALAVDVVSARSKTCDRTSRRRHQSTPGNASPGSGTTRTERCRLRARARSVAEGNAK